MLVNEAEDLSWSPKTHRIEQRTDFAKLSSDVYIHCVEQAFVCLYACTHNKHMNAERQSYILLCLAAGGKERRRGE